MLRQRLPFLSFFVTIRFIKVSMTVIPTVSGESPRFHINLKQNTPSETRLKLLEDEIRSLKSDKEMLEKCIHKKDIAIKQLKEDIQSFEERK